MRRFLQFETVGKPQFVAATLLLVYLAQCLWLIRVQSGDSERSFPQTLRIFQGIQQWRGGPIAGTPGSIEYENLPKAQFPRAEPRLRIDEDFDSERSPLYHLIAGAPLALWPNQFAEARSLWRWLALAPYLFFGVMLGGSLWYVARRLYGNAGGYIALVLYCFSPAMIFSAADISQPWRDGRSVGRFRRGVHRDRGRAHALRSPRGGAVELAPHLAARSLIRSGRR